MFKSFNLFGFQWKLIDDDFIKPVSGPYIENIIWTYTSLGLPVLPNLKMYYKFILKKSRLIRLEEDAYYLNRSYPELKFEHRYYKCLKNYIHQLQFMYK